MKKLYLFAALAAMLAACSENDLTAEKQVVQQNAEEGAVTFGAYVNRTTTRGGQFGDLDTPKLKLSNSVVTESNGFGVFAYYTNNVLYGQTAIPDFFYNQKVYFSTDWTYSPIKYWPNEFGTDAESTGQDRLTFFAYAPYVQVNPGTGRMMSKSEEVSGIVGLTSNNTTGDPYVKYIVSFDPDERVDLCFGVANSNFNSSVDGTNNNVAAGKPYIDVIKPKIGDKINFNFKHALAALNVQIDADIDEVNHGSNPYLDGNTNIYVRKVTFEGFTDKGSLNLNSEATSDDYEPNWFELNTINRRLSNGTVTIYDGRRDGKEGQAQAAASNETPNSLNQTIIQKDTPTDGVPAATQVNLFDSGTENAPIFVIPTDDDLKVTIVYDVETADPNLSTYLSDGTTKGSSVENTITKTITLGSSNLKLKAGKAYKVSLHLGMTSVKFDAEVTPWPVTPTSADDTYLPANANGEYASGQTHTITIPAASTGGTFTISGLTNTATATVTNDGIISSVTPTSTTISDGTCEVTYVVGPNATFYKKSGSIKITESGAGSSETTVNIIQSAQALGLSVLSVDATGGKDIVLKSTGEFAEIGDWTDVAKTKWDVVKKTAAGVTSTITSTTSFAGESKTSAKVTLAEEVAAGDEYIITVQTGEAAAETVYVKIGGIAFASPSQTVSVTAVDDKFAALTPIIYGNGIVAAGGWDSATTATATIDVNTGELTAVATGSSIISVDLTPPGASDGYFYTTNSKKAEYTLNLTVPTP